MHTEYFKNRRTIRNYTTQEIDDQLLNNIIEQAMRAPSTGNMQLYSVIVTRDIKMKELLSPAHFNQPSVKNCQIVLTICADFNRFNRWCKLSNANPGYDNFQSFMTATIDALIFSQQIVTIAEMNGIGTCYLGTVTYNAPQIAEILSLPQNVVPVACLTLGYPASTPEQCERIPVEAIMHKETYRNDSDQDILKFFESKDNFEANQKFIKENNKESLAQVFTDIRYSREANETFSKIFFDFINSQGFKIPF